MPERDDGLRRALQSATHRPTIEGVRDAIARKRRARELRRRAGSGVLAVAVVAGSIGGFVVLRRSVEPADGPTGVIAYTKKLRACDELPHVAQGVDAFAVTPDGGTQWDLTTLIDESDRLYSEEAVSFAPDGRRYAFVDHYRPGLLVADLVTGRIDRLVEGGVATPEWSPDGSTIAYTTAPPLRPGMTADEIDEALTPTIASVPASGGSPSELAVDASNPVWSPDGKTIAFLRHDTQLDPIEQDDGSTTVRDVTRTSLWFMDEDGSDEREMEVQPPGTDWMVIEGEWSPDSVHIAAEVSFGGNHDIVVGNSETRTGVRLTDHPAQDTSPTWSPDGSTIAFSTGRWGTGVGHSEIATISAEGLDLHRVTNDCWDDFEPEWVADDASIRTLPQWQVPPLPDLGTPGPARTDDILFSNDVEGVVDLYAIDPLGGPAMNLTADIPPQHSPQWSPDHRWIAFTQYEEGAGTLYVRNLDGSDIRKVASDAGRASWSPDGSRLVFESERGLSIVHLQTLSVEPLVEGERAIQPAWSPDGSTVAYTGDNGLWLVYVATGAATRLTRKAGDQTPDWSPDGSRIAFASGRSLAVINPDGTGARSLVQPQRGSYDTSPNWSPDGSALVFVSSREPDGDAREGGLWLWTVSADGSDLEPLPGSPRNTYAGIDW
jgi:Tol biopolymer transport system component